MFYRLRAQYHHPPSRIRPVSDMRPRPRNMVSVALMEVALAGVGVAVGEAVGCGVLVETAMIRVVAVG